jgi:hypothetical protein
MAQSSPHPTSLLLYEHIGAYVNDFTLAAVLLGEGTLPAARA